MVLWPGVSPSLNAPALPLPDGPDLPPPQAWLIACGAVYLLLLRPRLFAERDERKRHMEREAAEFAKYEEDWDRCVPACPRACAAG